MIIRCLNKIVLLVLLLVNGVLSAQTGFENEEDLKKKAIELWEQKDYSGALPLYSQLLSLYPKDVDYNYRFGSCMLFVEEDKKAPFKFLEYAVARPNVNPEAFFYLGKAYHLNYMFAEAKTKYQEFKDKGNSKEVQALEVDQHILMCDHGLNLLSNLTDLAVLDKRTLNEADFFRSYDVSSFGGKLLRVPDDFLMSGDKKADEASVMYLDKNSETLYFSSYGDKSKTGKDIYYVNRTPDGGFGEPQNIGSTVNTPYDEDFPFFNPNTNTLFFASKGHNSMGGYDVFKSEFNPSTGAWSKPQNLDYAVNTPDNDYLYITDATEKTAYFASSRTSPNGEVTVYRVNVERQPVDFVVLKGVFNSDETLAAKITVENNETGEIEGIFNTNGTNGEYILTLPNGGSYKFIVETDKSNIAYTGNVELPTQRVIKPLKQQIDLVVETGVEKLIIKNLFDQEVEYDGLLLTADFLKDRANLEVNASETKEEEPEVVAENDTIIEEPSSDFSNDELVKIAYADAEELKSEADLVQKQTDLAYAVANKKNKLSTDKSREADQLLEEAETTENERDKLNTLKASNDARNESQKLAKEAVAAYNLAKKLDAKAAESKATSDQAFSYALELDNAINSNSTAEIEAAYDKIKQMLEVGMQTDVLADLTKEYDEKKTLADVQIQKAIEYNDQQKELEAQLDEVRDLETRIKDKDEKEQYRIEAEEIESEIAELKQKAEIATNTAKELQEEVNVLEADAKVVAVVVDEIKNSNLEEYGDLATVDKSVLESEIASTENSMATNEQRYLEEDEKIKALAQTLNNGTEEEVTMETDSIPNETAIEEEPIVAIATDTTNVEENTVESNAVAVVTTTTADFINKEDIPKENYDDYFEQKLADAQKIIDEDAQSQAFEELYEQWTETTNNDITKKKENLASVSDETEKQLIEQEIAELESKLETFDNSNDEIADDGLQFDRIDKSEVPVTEYDVYYEEKVADIEQVENEYEQELKRADLYDNWVNSLNDELFDAEDRLETASKDEKKELKARITYLETELEDKRLQKATADLKAQKLADAGATLEPIVESEITEAETGQNDLVNEEGETTTDDTTNDSVIDLSEVPEEDYTAYFEEKSNEVESIEDASEKALAEIQLNQAWNKKANAEIANKQESLENSTDETEKELLQQEIEELAFEVSKREATLASSQATYDELASTETPTENVGEEIVEDATDSTAVEEIEPADSSTEEYNVSYYEEQATEIEAIEDASEKALAEIQLYQEWNKKANAEIANKQALLENSTDETEKELLQQEIEELAFEVSKREATLASSQAAYDELASTETPTENVGEEIVENATDSTATAEEVEAVDSSTEEYNVSYYEEQATEIEAIEDASEKALAEIQLYQEWNKKANAEIANKQALLENSTDETEKELLQQEIEELAFEVSKREATLASSQAAYDELASTETPTENVGEEIIENTTDSTSTESVETESPITEDIVENDTVTEEETDETEEIEGPSNNEITNENPFITEAEIPQEEYTSYFETKETELATIEDEQQKVLAEKQLYEAWDKKLNKTIISKEMQLTDETDDITAELLQQEIAELKERANTTNDKFHESEARYAELTGEDVVETEVNNEELKDSTSAEIPEEELVVEDNTVGETETDEEPIAEEVTAEIPAEERYSYKLTEQANGLQSEISSLQSESDELQVKIDETKDKGEKSELESEKFEVDRQLANTQTDLDLVEAKATAIKEVEEQLPSNPEFADEMVTKLLTESDELEFEAIELKERIKLLKDSVETIKKAKNQEPVLVEIAKLEEEAEAKFQQSATNHAVAEEVKKAAAQQKELVAIAEPLEMPEITKELTEEDKELVASSTEYNDYSAKRDEARRIYKEAEVFYAQADSVRELQQVELDKYNQFKLAADTTTDESAKEELMAEAAKFQPGIDAYQAQIDSIETIGNEIAKGGDVKDKEAATYLASLEQDMYENILAYEFTLSQDSARVAKELALANAARKASGVDDTVAENTIEEETEGKEAPEETIEPEVEIIAEEDLTMESEKIDIVPQVLKQEIIVIEQQPTKPRYNASKPIPIGKKLPDGLIFKVQVGAFRNPIPQDLFKGFAPIMGELTSSGLTRYTAGMFQSIGTADNAKNQIRDFGYNDAFVVAYYNGVRISIAEARNLIADPQTETIVQNTTIDNAVVNTTETTEVPIDQPVRTNGANDATGMAVSTDVASLNGLFYTVQVGVYTSKVPSSRLYNITPVNTDQLPNGNYRYSSGIYTSIQEATIAKNRIVDIGISDAFVTAYYNGERISVAESRDILAQNGNGALVNQAAKVNSSQNEPTGTGTSVDGVEYKILLGTYGEGVPVDISGVLLQLSEQGVDREKNNDGKTSYYLSGFNTFSSVNQKNAEIIELGLTNGVIEAYKDGNSISLDEAKTLTNE